MTTELTEDEWREATTYDLIDWHRTFSTEGERDAAWDRFLARVRRDAKAEALSGLADHIDQIASQFLGVRVGSQKAQDVRDYRDTHYPEEAE